MRAFSQGIALLRPQRNTGASAMKHPTQGIVRDRRAEEQPADKKRAQTVHRSDSKNAVSREATRDPKLTDAERKRNGRNSD
jgi:hypothetical protein